jgi:squalene-hopene/tetraprenyl-beta-curcumene cyclase
MKTLSTLMIFVLMIFVPLVSGATESLAVNAKVDVSLRLELENAIGKGLGWLAKNQQPAGNWAQPEYPALTALALTAFQGDPSGFYKTRYQQNIAIGYDFLIKNAKPDGGIYGKDLANYNTAIAMTALQVANNPAYETLLKNGRTFIIGLQDDFGEKGMGDDPLDGGIGYGGSYKHSDLANTTYALEALYYTRYLKGEEGTDLNWQAALQFISRTQNLTATNDQPWASDDLQNKGGFIYFPGDSKVKEPSQTGDKVALRSYGSMSYAGLLSMIYAQVDNDDPRVKAVIAWLSRNYSLDENPGMGQEGLFFYFHTMAKALSAAGVKTLVLADGTKIDWRQDLAHKLLDLQRADGSWANENGRWWEKDPNLVTCYATIALEIVYSGL